MNPKEKLKAYFKEHQADIKKELIDLTRNFVKEKTINVTSDQLVNFPFMKVRGEEYRVANIVKEKLKEYGIKYDEYAKMKERPNIIGRLGKNINGKSLFMPAHMDIVPAGDGWNAEPYEVIEKDNKLYGRGTLDNKGPLASILMAAKVLKTLGIDKELNGEFQVAALSDEEATDPDGIDYGIGYLIKERLIKPTYSVIPDIGEYMKKIDVAEKGILRVKITAIGKQAHGAYPERGINAVFMMAELINKLKNLTFEHKEHPLLGHPTLNLGIISGGSAINILPGLCYIQLDMRTVPGMTKDKMLQEIQGCINQLENKKFEIEVLDHQEPHGIDPNNELIKKIQENGEQILGIIPEPFGMAGTTFAKKLCLNGSIAVGWGIGDDNAFHVANESIEIQQLIDFSLLTCLLATDLLK